MTHASDVVQRHSKAFVKVLSINGAKLSLSMKDVEQETGKDLNPQNTKRLKAVASNQDEQPYSNNESATQQQARNPDRPDNFIDSLIVDEEYGSKKKIKQISDFEKWEIQQLRAANAIQIEDLPFYDEETGVLQKEDEEDGKSIIFNSKINFDILIIIGKLHKC